MLVLALNAQADKPKLKPKVKVIEYPTHWGEPPTKKGEGGTYLPHPWGGWGSYPLVKWIRKNQSNYPVHWGKPPLKQTKDYVKLPGPYGMGSTTLRTWIMEKMQKDKSSNI